MAMNYPLTYTQANQKLLQIGPITDAANNNAVVTNATVTATLWVNRVPGAATGTAIAGVNGVVLPHIANGIYGAQVGDSSFLPVPGSNYVTTFDLTTPGGGQAHWEIQSSVQPRTS